MLYEFNIKTGISSVLINSVQEYLSGSQLLTRLYQLDCVNVASFSTAFDGALIPAVIGTQN
jgi:hypothetical protein